MHFTNLLNMWKISIFILIISLRRNLCFTNECDLKNCSKFDPAVVLIRHNLSLVDSNVTSSINWKYLSSSVSGGGLNGGGFVADGKSVDKQHNSNNVHDKNKSDETTMTTIRSTNYVVDNTKYIDMNISNHDFMSLKTIIDDIGDNSFEEDLINNLRDNYFRYSSFFDPAKSASVSVQCKLDSQVFINSMRKFELWALRMHDSTGKITAGILNGNVNQLGDFDQCLSVENANENIQGQYCLAYIQATVSDNTKRLKKLHTLIQSHGLFNSKIEDPGHRVPRFSTINWALCVPSGCTNNDVELSLQEYVKNITSGTGVHLQVRVDAEMCQRQDKNWYENLDKGTKITGLFFLIILGIAVLSTIYDHKFENKNPWLTVFSLTRNTREIFKLERDKNDISCVHGIRFLNALMLIVSHKTMALLFNPYVNRTAMAENLGRPWTVIGRAAALYTDPFIMFSAFLTTYSLVGKLQRGQKLKIFQEYVGRFLRIAPPLGALILFCTYILPHLGSGPQWNLVVTHHADICKTYWWRNLMFIHNYFGFKEMCLTHTHHVGIDTQLFFISPIFILMLWKWPKKGLYTIVSIALIATVARYYITASRSLSNYVFFGTTVAQLFDTADYMYILPPYRSTVYIIGMLLAYFLRMHKDMKLTKTQLKIGWYVNTVLCLAAFFGPAPMGSINYVYNSTHAASYAAFSPIAWCCFFAWVVITSQLGYETYLSRFLSWRGFLITTRLSYAVYLTQFPVFFYNVGQTRAPEYYEFFRLAIFNLNELFWVILTSFLLTIFFETPFSNIKKLLFKSSSPKTQSAEFHVPKVKEVTYNKSDIKDLNE